MASNKPSDGNGSDGVVTPAPAVPKGPAKKAIPTPTRRQAEQARRDRITPKLDKKQSRAQEREAKYRSRDEAMAKANALPHNVMMRDYVDGRWSITEFVLPGIVVIFALSIVASIFWPAMMYYYAYIVWGMFALLVLDVLTMWLGLRQQLKLHFPNVPVKGKFSYAFSRMMQMRRGRIPAARVKRGTKFAWPNPADLR